jgi:hypothetical protein
MATAARIHRSFVIEFRLDTARPAVDTGSWSLATDPVSDHLLSGSTAD